ncbi:MAG TPA: hypothetical protein VE890_06915, partial [Thermoguttaceae bacterium]|nr:hypothetical protein [Thermoguttaceae bacterium]
MTGMRSFRVGAVLAVLGVMFFGMRLLFSADTMTHTMAQPKPTSYAPVVIHDNFDTVMSKMKAEKPRIEQRHKKLLAARYDLRDRPSKDVTMSGGKAIQEGVRIKLPSGVESWDALAAMTPADIRKKGLWPGGFLPLPHPNHAEGGMVFPKQHIDEIKRQEGRDLTRFDLDFD